MHLDIIEKELKLLIQKSDLNYIQKEEAIDPTLTGLQLFDEPLIGVSDAADELFVGLKEKAAVGPQFIPPGEWLPGAKSVISVFLPFSERVRISNRLSDKTPSNEWLHGRIEGQRFVASAAQYLKNRLEENGYQAIVPTADERFQVAMTADNNRQDAWNGISYASNWSERHVAYISGLGTFGLSKGLITEKGMAGRFFSVVTDANLPVTVRNYTGLYDYCIQCGVCIKRCPANAIDMVKGKDHTACHQYLQLQQKLCAPRYGCGKCQTGVPCESCNPSIKKA